MENKKVLVVGHLGEKTMGKSVELKAILAALPSKYPSIDKMVAKALVEKGIFPINAPPSLSEIPKMIKPIKLIEKSGRAKRRERRKKQRNK